MLFAMEKNYRKMVLETDLSSRGWCVEEEGNAVVELIGKMQVVWVFFPGEKMV
jgi:hypothetical protein